MATRLTDVYVPELYTGYQRVDSPEVTRFFDSGVINRTALLDSLSNQGGKIAEIPFWRDLDATVAPNVSNDNPASNATPEKVTAGTQLGIIARLNQGWSVMNLANEMSGDDPVGQINARVDRYFDRQFQRRLVQSCIGLAAQNEADDDGDMVIDVGTDAAGTPDAAELFSGTAYIDAELTLGDQIDAINAVAVHSVVYATMRKNDLIEFLQDSQGRPTIPTYMGKQVIVDDGLPAVAGTNRVKYTSVLFGAGAFGFGIGTPTVPAEIDRLPRSGNGGGSEELWVRRTWLLHPFGYALDPAEVAGDGGATLAELADPGLYARVVERKNVPLAFLVTNG
jgi:hypothetical protein